MASTDVIAPSRLELLVGDVETNRPVSEAILTRFGAQNNFINTYQTDIKEWKLNGVYTVATGITFFDGVASFFFNSEIVGINFYNGKSGSSGITEFDIIWKDSSGVTQGSIFSTTPKIDNTSLDETIAIQNLTTGNNVIPTGVTAGVFNKTTFFEGESLFFRLNGAMLEAQNCGFTIFYKPIN